jgi:hypothetical protein
LAASLAIAAERAPSIPSPAEIEAAGARIGEITIDAQNIFDLDDPAESNFLFRLANRLHLGTAPSVIRRALPFKSGDPFRVRLMEEAERLLRANRFIYDADIRPIAFHDGVVDLEVTTRDTWTLSPRVNFSRSGGANKSSFALQEYNLLGRGISVSFARSTDVDRTGNEFRIAQDRAWDGRTSMSYSYAKLTDGRREGFSLERPFYALDTRDAAGVSALEDKRIDSIYVDGSIVGQYRHHLDKVEAFAGWSDGLRRRACAPLFVRRRLPGRTRSPSIWRCLRPLDCRRSASSSQRSCATSSSRMITRRSRIATSSSAPNSSRWDFNATGQVGRSMTGLGANRNAWLYSVTVSDGFTLRADDQLLAKTSLTGEYGSAGVERQLFSAAARYYLPQSSRAVFFVSMSGDIATNTDPGDQLLLGGDTGLRGYPLRLPGRQPAGPRHRGRACLQRLVSVAPLPRRRDSVHRFRPGVGRPLREHRERELAGRCGSRTTDTHHPLGVQQRAACRRRLSTASRSEYQEGPVPRQADDLFLAR